ncbi:MAG: FixH family protein [Burkholderiales bacterium]|nr:FixH family protein [Burkholderiales bacterium]
MTRATTGTLSRPWYREPWPWLLMVAPGSAVIGGLVTAWLAITHVDPLVVDNYYKEGLAINQVLDRDREARRAGYRAQILFSQDGTQVRVHLTGAARLPASLRLRLVHPTRAERDAEALLAGTQAGWYEGALSIAPAPRWTIRLEGEQREWRLSGEWRPAEGGEVLLLPRA